MNVDQLFQKSVLILAIFCLACLATAGFLFCLLFFTAYTWAQFSMMLSASLLLSGCLYLAIERLRTVNSIRV